MIIRLMSNKDIEFAFECTRSVGWASSSPEVFQGYLEYDPEGCFIAEENNHAVGLCVATRYKNTGFIGELIVEQSMRGRGIGGALFRQAMLYLHNCNIRVIYLDGELSAVPIYEKYGFSKQCLSLRFIGKPALHSDLKVRQAALSDMAALVELDLHAFGDDRSFFLKRLFSMYPHYCLVGEHNNSITGFIMGRPGQHLVTAGPIVISDNSIDPGFLLSGLARQTGAQPLRIGVLESNQAAVDYFRSTCSFQEQPPCLRMVWGVPDKTGAPEMLFANGSGAKG